VLSRFLTSITNTHFSKLIELVPTGEEVIIIRAGVPVAKLVVALALMEKLTIITRDA